MTSPTVQTTEELIAAARENLAKQIFLATGAVTADHWETQVSTDHWFEIADKLIAAGVAVSPKVVTTVAELRARVMTVLTENGMTEGGNMHGWRCEYPDRYGPCDCCDLLADDLVAVLESATPVPPSEVK